MGNNLVKWAEELKNEAAKDLIDAMRVVAKDMEETDNGRNK